MLNPKQIRDLRQAIVQGSCSHEGVHFSKLPAPQLRDVPAPFSGLTEPGDTICIPAPEAVFGDPKWMKSQLSVSSTALPTKTIRLAHDAIVIGWRTAATPDGIYNSGGTSESTDLERILAGDHEGCVYVDGSIYVPDAAQTRERIPGTGLFLSHLEPGNYGSFLFRALPKLLYALEVGIRFDYIVTPHRYDAIFSALRLWGAPVVPQLTCRESQSTQLENLLLIDDFDAEGALDPRTVTRLARLAAACPAIDSVPRRKIYVSREVQKRTRPNYRPLVNEPDVRRVLAQAGFHVLAPETLSFETQLAIFRDAEFVAGPSGSGMLNAAFSPAGSRVVDMEFHAHTVRQHCKIYGSTGKRYAFVFGEPASDEGPELTRPWAIDPGLLAECLRQMAD